MTTCQYHELFTQVTHIPNRTNTDMKQSLSQNIYFKQPLVAKCIGDGQIIVQQVRRYSRVLVCMYMSAKNSRLSIVGL